MQAVIQPPRHQRVSRQHNRLTGIACLTWGLLFHIHKHKFQMPFKMLSSYSAVQLGTQVENVVLQPSCTLARCQLAKGPCFQAEPRMIKPNFIHDQSCSVMLRSVLVGCSRRLSAQTPLCRALHALPGRRPYFATQRMSATRTVLVQRPDVFCQPLWGARHLAGMSLQPLKRQRLPGREVGIGPCIRLGASVGIPKQ